MKVGIPGGQLRQNDRFGRLPAGLVHRSIRIHRRAAGLSEHLHGVYDDPALLAEPAAPTKSPMNSKTPAMWAEFVQPHHGPSTRHHWRFHRIGC